MFWTFIEDLIKQQVNTYIASTLWTTQVATGDTVVHTLVGSILGGLAKNTRSQSWADALLAALDRDHDGSILDDLGNLAGLEGDGSKIIQHIMWGKKEQIIATIAQKTQIDTQTITKLLDMVAPVVMGTLGKQKRTNNLDAKGIADVLTKETTALQQDTALSPLLWLLDKDGDGDVDLQDFLG